MARVLDFELKTKSKKVIAFLAITFQLLAFFGVDLGLPEQLKPMFFGLAIFGYSFFILPHLDVWQKTKSNEGK